ncbi:MAG: hypothetical protein ACJ79G_03750 [Myxococcales bacterium]
MSPPGRSLPEKRGRWRLLLGAAWDDLPKAPHLEEDLRELERISKDVEGLALEKLRLMAESQTVTAKIRTLSRQGDRLRGRIGASLKGYYGFDAERLIAFGFKPRRSKERDPETERSMREGAGQKGEGNGDSG